MTLAAIRWYVGEIRLLRLRIPGLTLSAFGRLTRKLAVINRAEMKMD